MDTTTYDALWRCAGCRTWKVVPTLARDCETRHTRPVDPDPPPAVP